MTTAARIDVATPPSNPSTVFFGLMRGESFRFPNVLPT